MGATGSPTDGTSATARFRPLPIATGWGPTAAEISRGRALVGGLSLRERAGQVIMASYAGTAAPTAMVRRLHLGGVVVFSENIASTAAIRDSNRRVQAGARAAGRSWPVLIGVDQEGGRVARVAGAATSFPTFMSTGAARDPALTRRAYAASGAELADLGFTVDFAPDADVTQGPNDPTIGARSAGSDPAEVSTQVLAAVRGFASSGVLPVIKHFPGHGSVSTDSHVGLPVQRASVKRLWNHDLVPFRDAVAAHVPAVMVGHLDVRAVDPRVPSSVSHGVVTGLLRDRVGFGGVAFTDSLVMHAVADRFGTAGAAARALEAGQDVLLMPRQPRVARDGIVAAVRSGRLHQARLDQAATRVVALALHQQAQRRTGRPPGSGAAVSQELSARALTSVLGPCSGRLVGRAVKVAGPASAVATFTASARSAGLPVKAKPTKKLRPTVVRLLGPGDRVPTDAHPDVVVALDTPYALGASHPRVAAFATYGETPGAMQALVSVLLGRSRAPGRLPVPVAGVSRSGC